MGLQLGRAVGIVMQTAPYVGYRALVYGVICFCVAVYLGILGLIGAVFGSGAFLILLVVSVGLGALLGVGKLLREYVLYLLKTGHVALVTEIVTEGRLPEGISQTQWAKERVLHYFKEISVLALVDQFVKGIIQLINRTLLNVMSILPIPGAESAAGFAQRIVDFSLTYVDESVVAYTFKTKNENVFDAAKTAIILYCQCWKELLKNAVSLTLLSYVFVVLTAIIFLMPLGMVALLLPKTWGGVKLALFLLALFMGVSAKWILFDPIACTSTILTFLEATRDLTPDAEWEARLESTCDKFRELKEKAAKLG